MKQEEKKFNHVYLLNGARFKNPNAACHRAIGIGKLFRKYANEVFIFGFSNDGNDQGELFGFKYRTFKYPSTKKEWMNYSFSIRFYRNLLEELEQNDLLIINNSIPSFVMKKIIRFCAKKKIRFILDVDEWYAYKIDGGLLKSFVKNLSTWYQMNIICKKRYLFIVSSSFLQKHCDSSEGTFVFPALVTEKIIETSERNYLTTKEKTADITLFFGGFFTKREKKESLDSIIQAIDEINGSGNSVKFQLIIAGQTGENKENVTFLGPLPYKECVEELVKSTFTIIPRSQTRTNQAGFPTKLSESFLYGIPCIATDTSDIKQYIENGINGYIVENNSKECYLRVFNEISKEYKMVENYKCDAKERVRLNNRLVLDYFVDEFDNFVRGIK